LPASNSKKIKHISTTQNHKSLIPKPIRLSFLPKSLPLKRINIPPKPNFHITFHNFYAPKPKSLSQEHISLPPKTILHSLKHIKIPLKM